MVYGNRGEGALVSLSARRQDWSDRTSGSCWLLGESSWARCFAGPERAASSPRARAADRRDLDPLREAATPRGSIEIDNALKVIGCFIGSGDQGVLYRFSADGSVAKLTNEWVTPGCRSIRAQVNELKRRDVRRCSISSSSSAPNTSSPEQLPPGFEAQLPAGPAGAIEDRGAYRLCEKGPRHAGLPFG
jgi:hypothetical protein